MEPKECRRLDEIEKFVLEAGSDHLDVFGGSYVGGAHIQQVPDEIAPCIHFILESGEDISSYLEIGAAAGGTTYLLNHFFQFGRIVLIDDNAHPKARFRSDILSGIERKELIGSSRKPKIVKNSKGVYDLMLIDGDHTYHGVRTDIDNYLPFLRPGGFLILHDSIRPQWGVMRVVSELKAEEGMEFIAEYVSKKHSHPCGVVLFKKAKKAEGKHGRLGVGSCLNTFFRKAWGQVLFLK